jgi:hypothetical protein
MCKEEKGERGEMGKAQSTVPLRFSMKTTSFPFFPLSLFSFPYTLLQSVT